MILFLVFSSLVGECKCGWTAISLQGDNRAPPARYNTGAVVYDGALWVTHGYAYDHSASKANYMNCTWRFDLASRKWGHVRADSQTGPSPRHGHSLTLMTHDNEDKMCLFGGNDGGLRFQSSSYVWGASFNDLWCFTFQTLTWECITSSGARPARRHQHVAVNHNNRLVVFGGLIATLSEEEVRAQAPQTGGASVSSPSNDVWVHVLGSGWTMIQSSSPPPARYGHVATVSMSKLYVFGGTSGKKNVLDDVWVLSLDTFTWDEVQNDGKAEWPSARQSHGAAALNDSMLVFGGADCSKVGCQCNGELWEFSFSARTWRPVLSVHSPTGRYQHAFVAKSAHTALLFGGESYKPYMYYNDLWEVSRGSPSSPQHSAHALLPLLFLAVAFAVALRLLEHVWPRARATKVF